MRREGLSQNTLWPQSLGLAENSVRDEWAAFDLETPSGIKLEVISGICPKLASKASFLYNLQNPKDTRLDCGELHWKKTCVTSHCTGRGRISGHFHPVPCCCRGSGWVSRRQARAGEFFVGHEKDTIGDLNCGDTL